MIPEAKKGGSFGMKVSEPVREGDRIIWSKKALEHVQELAV